MAEHKKINDNQSELIAEAKMWQEPGVTPIGEARLILDLAAEIERMHKVYLKLVNDLSTEQVENKLLKQQLSEYTK